MIKPPSPALRPITSDNCDPLSFVGFLLEGGDEEMEGEGTGGGEVIGEVDVRRGENPEGASKEEAVDCRVEEMVGGPLSCCTAVV